MKALLVLSLIFLNQVSWGCEKNQIKTSLEAIKDEPSKFVNKRVHVSGYFPGIPSLLLRSKDHINDKPVENGVFIDIFELGYLNDCLVGNVQLSAVVVKKGAYLRFTSIEDYKNTDLGVFCKDFEKE